jgi:peptidoglycan/xylan/chitin deacetylase (PgdA/CDA1 family)
VSAVPEPETLGYGFDDGPNCTHNVFYDYLASQNQKATMFYIGSNVFDWPLEAQRALADGHEICARE